MTHDLAAPPTAVTGAPARPGAPAGTRIRGVDGLRAIAVALVLFFHLAPEGAVPGGFVGVDVFFVVSGFLITSLLLRERARTGSIRLGAFWIRRARRLLPAVVLLILVCGSVATLLGGDLTVRLGQQVLGALTFSSNWILVLQGSGYFDQAAPELFRNLWSLAVEEQFYLVWPLLLLVLLALPRAARPWIVGVLAVASAVAAGLLVEPDGVSRVYYGTDTHSFGILLGALLALLDDRPPVVGSRDRRPHGVRALGLVGLAGIVAIALLVPEGSPAGVPVGLIAASVATFLVLRALREPGAALGRVLDLAPLRWIGVRSYGIYLWHWPVFVLLGAALPAWDRDAGGGWTLGGLAAGITVLVAAFSYGALEAPIRRDGFRRTARLALGWWRWGARSAVAASLVVLLVVAGGITTGVGIASDPGTTSTERQVESGRRAIERPAPTPSPRPSAAPPAGDQVLVIGDSVTLAAAPQVQEALPGVLIDAAVSRQMSAAPQFVDQHRADGTLRPVLVLALGTNGGFDPAVLDEVRDRLGPDRELVLVTTQEPRSWEASVNAALTAFAQRYRNVELSNWHDAIQPDLDQLNRDQVHFGGFGARVWTANLMAALQRLAELPAMRDDRDYAGLPRPV